MLRNYFFINLMLLVIIGFLGVKFYEVYMRTTDIPEGPAAKQVQKENTQVKSEDRAVDPSIFQVISNMDLFRPARSPYRGEPSQQALPKTPPRLFGTVILDNEKTAILEDPDTKATRSYHVNESIGNYVISEILEDRVILMSNGERSEVRLREEKKGLPPVRHQIIPLPTPPQIPPPQVQQQTQPQPVPALQQPVQRQVPQRPRPVPLKRP
jgi:type II secretory pathway component PulC